jgi:hypothetical protein
MRPGWITVRIWSPAAPWIAAGGVLGVLALSVVACSDGKLDLGSTSAGGGDVSSGGLDSLVGTWTGYAEAFTFPSGSDRIALVFASAADGSISGTVTYGQGTPPAPPTDPSVGYPVGTDWRRQPTTWLIEGYPFTGVEPSFDGTRLQIHTVTSEPWKAWCELQTPTNAGFPSGEYGCLPDWPGMSVNGKVTLTDPATGATETVDYGKLMLCGFYGQVCACSAASCTVAMNNPDAWFDMQLSGTAKLDGTLTLAASGKLTVHFARSP